MENAGILARVAADVGVGANQAAAVSKLLAEGSTVPFIARYRKEAHGNLDEVQIGKIQDRLGYYTELEERKATVLKSIDEQGKLTDELREKIAGCWQRSALEDLYQPYKPKRRTRAQVAKEKGFEPLADDIWNGAAFSGSDEDLQYARDIIAERIADMADVRGAVRQAFITKSKVKSEVASPKPTEPTKFEQYYDFEEPLATIPSHRYLAIKRGQKEGVLWVRLELDKEPVVEQMLDLVAKSAAGCAKADCAEQIRLAAEDAYKRLLAPSCEIDASLEKKAEADRAAVEVFAENLRHLLLASPLGEKAVLAIDPGIRTGCKVAMMDSTGKYLGKTVIFPMQKPAEAEKAIALIVHKYKAEAIAVGNGTAGRETEAFVRATLKKLHEQHPEVPIPIVVSVSESGASVYSASEIARKEFPDLDLTVRGAISIGRRLQDPLAELVKIDPKAIGVGQYQHDVHQPLLGSKLDEVVVSCVNGVGVELNTASAPLLERVSGLTPTLAKSIVEWRDANGKFSSREQLKKVKGLGPKTFEQCAGFLRIRGAANPLDASAVHPERYALVEKMAADVGLGVGDLVGNSLAAKKIDIRRYITNDVGEPTLKDIVAELIKPGRDPRKAFEPPKFRDDVTKIEDVKEGMKLEGVVTNVTAFGVFVDIGVHQDGLIHVSELSDSFVTDPSRIVKAGDRLQVTVIGVDQARKRISLSAKSKPTVGAHAGGGSGGGAQPARRGPRTSFAPPSGSGFSCNPFSGVVLPRMICMVLFSLVASVAVAEVGLHENILLNPGFSAMPGQAPQYWDVRKYGDLVAGSNALEPGSNPAVTVTGKEGNDGFSLHQYGLRLLAGGRYRLSAKVRTSGFQTQGQHGFRLCNEKWRWAAGFNFPTGTHDWQRLSSEFVAEKSLGTYYVVIYATKSFSGKIEVADAKLEALDEETCRNTSRSGLAAVMTMPRLVPLAPLLHEIPSDSPEVLFRFFGTLPAGDVSDYDVRVVCGGGTASAPLSRSDVRVRLPGPSKKGEFTASVVGRLDEKCVFSRTYGYALRDVGLVPTAGRKLNNLVTEYFNDELKAGASCERRLALARSGWVYVSAAAESVQVDGKAVVGPATPRHEAFLELGAGEHVISVVKSAGGALVVRGIPELFDYCMAPGVLKENPPFDWPFFERFVLPAVTTANGNVRDPAMVEELRKRGRIWLGNVLSTSLGTDDDIIRRLTGTSRIDSPHVDGATCDEQYLSLPEVMSHYAAGLWRYKHPQGKRVYTWIVGAPAIQGIDHDVVSAAINATEGQGKVLAECYAATYESEAAAEERLRKWLGGVLARYDEYSPVLRPKFGVILGNYTQSPGMSLWGHPEVDFRYFLDMQFNLIANDPVFSGIGCTGVWGSHRAEEEVHRWTFMLMRHYFVEGRRDMLSPKYGFRYISGHTVNGDFERGLESWKAAGAVTTGRVKKLGLTSEGRRCGSGACGDTFAVLKRGKDVVSTVSQRVVGLVPGKAYCLRYAVLDAKEAAAEVRGEPREYPLWAVLPDGFDVCGGLSWSHVDAGDGQHGPRANMRHVVFTARAAEMDLVFTTASASPGDELALNCVSVHPYLPRPDFELKK